MACDHAAPAGTSAAEAAAGSAATAARAMAVASRSLMCALTHIAADPCGKVSDVNRGAVVTAGAAAGGALAAALWWRAHPSACPYGQRFWVQAPHPLITRARLLEALAPQPGERCSRSAPARATTRCRWRTASARRAAARVRRPAGDARPHDAPGPRGGPRQRRAVARRRARAAVSGRDLRRRLSRHRARRDPRPGGRVAPAPARAAPGGRLVVGELFVDPHMVTERTLRRRGEAAGLRFERRVGSRLGYFGVLRA